MVAMYIFYYWGITDFSNRIMTKDAKDDVLVAEAWALKELSLEKLEFSEGCSVSPLGCSDSTVQGETALLYSIS